MMRYSQTSLRERLDEANGNFTKIRVSPSKVLNVEIIEQTGRKISDFPFIVLFPEDEDIAEAYLDSPAITRTEHYVAVDGMGWGVELSDKTRIGKVVTYRTLRQQIGMSHYEAILLVREDPEVSHVMQAYGVVQTPRCTKSN